MDHPKKPTENEKICLVTYGINILVAVSFVLLGLSFLVTCFTILQTFLSNVSPGGEITQQDMIILGIMLLMGFFLTTKGARILYEMRS